MPAHVELRRRLEQAESRRRSSRRSRRRCSAFPEREFSEFTVCTRDRPGLFSMISGRARGARHEHRRRAHRHESGRHRPRRLPRLAARGADATLDRERWERVERTLRAVLPASADVEELVPARARPSMLDEKRRPRGDAGRDRQPGVEQYTVLDVYAATASACCSRSPTPLPPRPADPPRQDHDHGRPGARRVLRDRRRRAEDRGRGATRRRSATRSLRGAGAARRDAAGPG